MKADNKVVSIASGLFFLWQVIKGVRAIISLVAAGVVSYMNPITLLMWLYGIIVEAILGVNAMRQKKRSKLLNGFGIVHIGYVVVGILAELPYSFNVRTLAYIALWVAAFVYSQKACGGSVFDISDTASEAAKIQIQAQKQTAIYDEQLRDGILTQEEYDQIMKNNN